MQGNTIQIPPIFIFCHELCNRSHLKLPSTLRKVIGVNETGYEIKSYNTFSISFHQENYAHKASLPPVLVPLMPHPDFSFQLLSLTLHSE